jgi:uncharacterized membrane protein
MTNIPRHPRLTSVFLAAAVLSGGLLDVMAADAAAGGANRFFQWRPFLAPFHSVVLHFPIGFLTIAGILEIYRVFRPSDEVRRINALILWLGLLTGVISVTFGLMRAGGGEYDPHMLNLHRVYGLAVPVVTAVTLALQSLATRQQAARGWTGAYRLVLLGTLGLVVVAGHYGGNLTHGSKYLVENAPDFVREMLDEAPEELATPDPANLDTQARVFVEKVQPLLQKKCYKCHGPDKQKGGYRLDQPELVFKAGDSGKPPIKAGDPIGSYMVQLILLPPQHDDVMPPEGKEPLDIEEIVTLLDWVRHGAVVAGGSTNQLPVTRSSPGTAAAAVLPAR